MKEQNIEKKNKKSNKALIIINIVAVLIISGIATYYFFVFDKKDTRPRDGRVGIEISSEDFCEQWEEKQVSLEGRQPPAGMQRPDGAGNFQSIMEDICEDGEISNEEQKELDELRVGFKKSSIK